MMRLQERLSSPTAFKWAAGFGSTFLFLVMTHAIISSTDHTYERTNQLQKVYIRSQTNFKRRDNFVIETDHGKVEIESDPGELGGFNYYNHHMHSYPHHHNENNHETSPHDEVSNDQESAPEESAETAESVQKESVETTEAAPEEDSIVENSENEGTEESKVNVDQEEEEAAQLQEGGDKDGKQYYDGQSDSLDEKKKIIPQVEWTCEWSPTSPEQCNDLLFRRLPAAGGRNDDRASTSLSSIPSTATATQRQRWLFMGDSTMRRQFTLSNLDDVLVHTPHNFTNAETETAFVKEIGNLSNLKPCWSDLECEIRHSDQCELNSAYGLEKAQKWRKPIFFPNFEGPVNNGYKNPYCSDCKGCDTTFLDCRSINQTEDRALQEDGINNDACQEEKLVYGGYMMVEFSKDVEIQSPYYKTTQENIAFYIREHYNTPELLEAWGKPICVISTGFHDMIILTKTDHFNMERFVENVQWYLTTMKSECSHIVWLTNSAPSVENPNDWPQTIELTYQWNQGVKVMIEKNEDLLQMVTFVDVFQASIKTPNLHDDHIHKADSWYANIGGWFSSLITKQYKNIDDDLIMLENVTYIDGQSLEDNQILDQSVDSSNQNLDGMINSIDEIGSSIESVAFDDQVLTESIDFDDQILPKNVDSSILDNDGSNYQTLLDSVGFGDPILPENIRSSEDQIVQERVDTSDYQTMEETTSPIEDQTNPNSFPIPDWTCEWSPSSHDDCDELLSKRLPYVNDDSSNKSSIKRQRWLFFGDSTVKRQFTLSNLDRILVDTPYKLNTRVDPCWSKLECEVRHSDRCGLSAVFDFDHPRKWRKPKFYPNFEGPTNYGFSHPYCSDCAGCDPEFLHCEKRADYKGYLNFGLDYGSSSIDQCNEEKLVYGGFMMVEYAKDVALQTPDFHTTQENTAWYIHQHYNSPELLELWGLPICVISIGFHDMVLLTKTDGFNKEKYIENVSWYLSIMQQVCGHIVWVTNTAPSMENPKNWPQTVEITDEWNEAVREMIEQKHDLLEKTTFVDVFQASLSVPQLPNDHIHKIDSWYKDIGYWFVTVITGKKVIDEQFIDS